MSADQVLYDAPGPRARKRAAIAAVVALVALAALAVVAVLRLAERGQFDADLWRPLFDPTTDEFPLVWNLIWQGLLTTLVCAVLAIVASLVLGTLLGSLRVLLSARGAAGRVLVAPIVVFIELFRGLPVVITIFLSFAFFRFIDFRLDFLPGQELLWYVAIGLTFYNSVIIAEILRAGIASIPRGQGEAARAIGLTESGVLRLVLLPQAFRVMLPALISQLVVILKDTSLGAFLGFLELLNRGLRISQNLDNPIQVLLLIGAIYVLLNYSLSRLAVWLEGRLRGGGARSGAKDDLASVGPAA